MIILPTGAPSAPPIPAPPFLPPFAVTLPPFIIISPMYPNAPAPIPAAAPCPAAVTVPPSMTILPILSRFVPLSRPIPAPPLPPVEISSPASGFSGVSSSRSIFSSVPFPTVIPAKPLPLVNTFLVPLPSVRVTLFSCPVKNARPIPTSQFTPSRVSDSSPVLLPIAILPLKGVPLASVPEPPDIVSTAALRIRSV